MTNQDLEPDDDDAYWRDMTFLAADDQMAGHDWYPALRNISAGMIYGAVLRAEEPEPAEYVTLPINDYGRSDDDRNLDLAVSKWNTHWEAAQFRRRIYDEDELPSPIAELADQGDINIMFAPRTRSRYFEHAPLFHLLPAATLERYGMPMLRAGQWPFLMGTIRIDQYLPEDFETRLSRAWASAVWRHLFPTSPLSGFSASDPIRLLAHNLDFWIPAVNYVIQRELGTFSEVDKASSRTRSTSHRRNALRGRGAGQPSQGWIRLGGRGRRRRCGGADCGGRGSPRPATRHPGCGPL